MVNPGASRSFVASDSDDDVPHGPGDRADSFDNAGSLHVALAAARPVHNRRHSTSGLGHSSYRPALEYGNDHTGKIAQAVDPAWPDMDEACDGWNSAPACVHQHGVGQGPDLRLGSPNLAAIFAGVLTAINNPRFVDPSVEHSELPVARSTEGPCSRRVLPEDLVCWKADSA
jgi:hypothetical protein